MNYVTVEGLYAYLTHLLTHAQQAHAPLAQIKEAVRAYDLTLNRQVEIKDIWLEKPPLPRGVIKIMATVFRHGTYDEVKCWLAEASPENTCECSTESTLVALDALKPFLRRWKIQQTVAGL